MTQHFNGQAFLGPTVKGKTASTTAPAAVKPAAASPLAAASTAAVPAKGAVGIGGTPAGATGTVGQFGQNTLPGVNATPATGGLGAQPYTAPSPWANHLLSSPPPVSPSDPAANLFRTMTPNAGTPSTAAPTPSYAGNAGQTPGPMMRPNPYGGGAPAGPMAGTPSPAGGQPSVMPPGGGGYTFGIPNGPSGPGAMPMGPSGPTGAPMPGRMSPGYNSSPYGPAAAGGIAAPQIGGFNTPSPLLAASNPASASYQPPGAASAGAASAPRLNPLSAVPGGGTIGGNTMQGSNQLPPGMTPQQLQQMFQNTSGFGAFREGGGVRRYDSGGAASASDPDVPSASGVSSSDRLAQIISQLSHNPPQRNTQGAQQEDPIMSLLSPPQSGGGGSNSVGSVLGGIGVPYGPHIARVGGAGYAAGGSPLAMVGQSSHRGHVAGPSGGQDDDVNARLSDGEYVMDADTVSNLGDGNNEAGAKKLDEFRQNIRTHKRAAPPTKIPPKAKKPQAYLLTKGKKTAAKASAEASMSVRR